MIPWGRKRDSNQEEVRLTFQALGWAWIDTSHLGRGFPDAIALSPVWWGLPVRVVLLVEIKSRYGKLTPAEEEFHRTYPGSIATVRSTDDVREVHRRYKKLCTQEG